MKKIPALALVIIILGCRSLSAQVESSSTPLPGQPAIISIEEALGAVGITNIVYKNPINIGDDIGTLYEQASFDPNALEVLLYKTGAGQIKLVTTWEYFTPVNNTNVLYKGQVANPADNKALLGSAGTLVVVDTTRAVQIQSDHSLVKVYGTDGYTYLLRMLYVNDGTNWYMVFEAPNNLAPNGGTTRTAPVPPSNPPAQ